MQTLKTNIKVLSIIFCLALTFFSDVLADDAHYVNMIVGNRSSGLGGAYTALSDDPSGCYYNPAGIAFAPAESLSASVNAINKSTKIYRDALNTAGGGSQDWEQESFSLLPNYFGIVKKIGPGVLGLSYAVPDSIDRRLQQHFYNIASIDPNNDVETYIININDNDKTYLFGPSYAYGFSDSLSIGATVYVYYRDMEFIRNQLLQFEQGEHVLANFYDTKEDWGFKPVLGVIFEPLDKLAIGLSVSKIYITSSDNDMQTIYRNTFSPDYNYNGASYDFSMTDTILYTTLSTGEKDKFPLTVSLGFAYFFSSKLLIAGDMVYSEKIDEKETVVNVSLGTEYYFRDDMALRTGFYTDYANTEDVSSGYANQEEHVDIYGLNFSLTRFSRSSSITLGFSYGQGTGDAQIISDSTVIQDVVIRNTTFYISSSYNY